MSFLIDFFSGNLNWLIFFSRFPNLRLLDFRKIKQKDRLAAVEFFKSKKGKEVLKEINKKAKLHVSSGQQDVATKGMTISQWNWIRFFLLTNKLVPGASVYDMQRIREAIKKAGSLQEVERLTRILQTGQIPQDLMNINGSSNGDQMETS